MLVEFELEQTDVQGRYYNLLDVIEAKQEDLYTPNGDFKIGRIYKERLAIGVEQCNLQFCQTNEAILLQGVMLQVAGKPDQYNFKVFDNDK
jgi:hypothetical protein